MPLPQPEIVNALLETYLTLRKDEWKLDDEMKLDNYKKHIQTKLEACAVLLQKVKITRSAEGWVNFLKEIATETRQLQEEENNKTSGITGFFYQRLRPDMPLQLKTFAAIRSYILARLQETEFANGKLELIKATLLKNKDTFEKEVESLKSKNEDTTKALEKLKNVENKLEELGFTPPSNNMPHFKKDYHKAFFAEIIKDRDNKNPAGEKYGEYDFDDYAKSVLLKKRGMLLTENLLKSVSPTVESTSSTTKVFSIVKPEPIETKSPDINIVKPTAIYPPLPPLPSKSRAKALPISAFSYVPGKVEEEKEEKEQHHSKRKNINIKIN